MAALKPAPGPQILHGKGQILSILARLQREHSLLAIGIVGSNREFCSAVLQIDRAQQIVTLDELHPARGHDLVAAGTELRVLARVTGVETRFQLRIASVGIEDGTYYYTAALPDEVLYYQFRQHVRVPVRLTLQTSCQLIDEQRRLDIHLTDLSAGGFGAYVRGQGEVTQGEILRFEIELDGVEPLIGEAQIRYSYRESVRKRLNFGAQFMELPPRERSRLARMVAAMQRELLRST